MDTPSYLLSISIHRMAETYVVELSHSDPTSQARVAPVRGVAAFDGPRLLAHARSGPTYGEELARQVFADAEVARRFAEVRAAADASDRDLRILVCIDPSAQELQALRWEHLRDPASNAALATSERVLLSRFMVSRDFRPVRLRARTELTALVAVAAPDLTGWEFAPVDFSGESSRITATLAGVQVRVLGGPDAPCTLARLLDEIRRGVDILYLVSHGMFQRGTGTPALILQGEAGEAVVVRGDELALRLGEQHRVPRLVVLASCESAGDGTLVAADERTTVQATLAGRLADAGVPAVLAMQGRITMGTVARMMPVFFRELLRDGQIDRALAVARGVVKDQGDHWMPALYTRLTDGRLWYTPGFRSARQDDVWASLLVPVKKGKVVPIIGPRLLETACGSAHDAARKLAGIHHYPLHAHEWDDLPRVTEYMSVKESRFNVLQAYQDQLLHELIEQHRGWLPPEELPPRNKHPRLGKLLALVSDRLRGDTRDPHRILAELGASVYVTTNFDPLLERALRAAERTPQQVATRWRYQQSPRPADEDRVARPSTQAPLVYHVFGAFGASADDDGLVLTEDDYFDYLLTTAATKLMPPEVEGALVSNSLLFLGFRLTDWHFRVLFRLMMSLPGRKRLEKYCHVAVQLDPDLQTMSDVAEARAFLAKYFGQKANINIYWGSSEDFLTSLRDALAAAGDLGADDKQPHGSDDGWDF